MAPREYGKAGLHMRVFSAQKWRSRWHRQTGRHEDSYLSAPQARAVIHLMLSPTGSRGNSLCSFGGCFARLWPWWLAQQVGIEPAPFSAFQDCGILAVRSRYTAIP